MRGPGTLSRRVADLRASPIRDILAVIDRPGMISFAGGLPCADTFPRLRPDAVPPGLLQYGASEGEPQLRQAVAADLAAMGLACTAEQVLILSGSQQGIDLVAKLFIDPGTPVAVESPTYLAALQVFRFFGARLLPFDPARPGSGWPECLPDGQPDPGAPASAPSFIYAIPTFQNPTGRCYTAAERAALAAFCDDQHLALFEDDPYRDLVYDDCDRTPVCARIQRASWVYQGSFSKSLAPGLRLGFLAASTDLLPYLTRLKQAADLHSNRVSQWLVLQQLHDAGRTARLERLAANYRRKRDHFAAVLQRRFGEPAGGLATWQLPPGGLFFWLQLARPIDTRALLPEAIARGVAFMPGEPFFPGQPERCGALRLNFSHAGEEQCERGLAVLSELVAAALAGKANPH
jgi:DNA-binding transcriptional MocR family regulator